MGLYEKQYTWNGDQKRSNEEVARRYAFIACYVLFTYAFMRRFLCAVLYWYYGVKFCKKATDWLINPSLGVNVYLRSLAHRFPPSGAVLEVIYIMATAFGILGIVFNILLKRYFGTGGEDSKSSHGSAHFASLDEIKQAGFTVEECKLEDPVSGQLYAVPETSGIVLCNYIDEKTGKKHLVMDTGSDHCLLNATTRSGKGVAVITGTNLQWKESLFVVDIKGENWLLSSGYRASELGQYCLRFDPTDPGNEQKLMTEIADWIAYEAKAKGVDLSFEKITELTNEYYIKNKEYLGTARWNPLADVQLGTPIEISQIQVIATMIADPKGEGLKDYWAKAGFELLTGAISYECYKARKEGYEPSLATVLDRITSPNAKEMFGNWVNEDLLTNKEAVSAFLQEGGFGNASGREITDQTNKQVKTVGISMQGKADNELSGVVSSAKAELSGIFLDPIVCRNLSRATFSINDIVNSDRPVSVYLTVPPSDQARMTPIIRLFIVMLILQLTGRMVKDPETGKVSSGHLHRLLLMLDEFPQLKKLEQVQSALAQMAGYGLKACVVVQSLTQLRSIYGKDENVSSNCNVQIAFAPNDNTTAQELSNMCGKKTESVGHMTETIDDSGGLGKRHVSRQISYSEHERPLLYPDEILHLPSAEKDEAGMIEKAGQVLVFSKGFPVIRAEQALYFQNKEWLRRSKLLPPIISVNTKERVYLIRKAIEDWQRQHKGASVQDLISNKQNAGAISVLSDKVIRKWYNPILRRDPNAETEITIETANREIRKKKHDERAKAAWKKYEEEKAKHEAVLKDRIKVKTVDKKIQTGNKDNDKKV